MKSQRITLFIPLFLMSAFFINAQSLTIEDCQRMARENYPAIARFNIIENIKNFTLENANTAYFPQLSLNARTTWQSDVTKIDFKLPPNFPPVDVPFPDKDQHQVYAQLNQIIWDGGKVAAQKENIAANAEVEKQKLETEIYSLQERVNHVFFGILLLNEQLAQQTTLEKELQRNYGNVQSYVANGVANDADLSAVKVEQLKANQQRIYMESALDSYIKILSVLIGQNIDEKTTFVKPPANLLPEDAAINRPELQLIEAQSALLNSQETVLNAKNRPVIGAFAQGGYGKPALNMLSNKFKPYFMGGVSLSWNFGSLYTYKHEKKSIEQQKLALHSQRETFLYSLNLQLPQQQNEIKKYYQTMQDDDEIIRLRRQIKDAAEVKVENGTLTVSDLLQEINALEIVKQAKSLHEIQYLISIYNLRFTLNGK